MDAGSTLQATRGTTLVLTRSDVRALLDMDACIAVVEDAFRAQAAGDTRPSGVLGTHVPGGGFHVKTAALVVRGREYFAAKVNANFPQNPSRHGLPTIQGAISLHDASTGVVLALLDSIEITTMRTAAATAVAARHLARPNAGTVTIVGCGTQGRGQLLALSRVRPVRHVYAFDVDPRAASAYAVAMTDALGCAVEAVTDYRAAARRSDMVVTCTPARRPLLSDADVSPGVFVAAVGADSEGKQELEPALLAASTLVVDVLEQCATIGELHHALAAGVLRREDVHAELADVVGGRRPGRTSPDEVIVFDSTGTALEDVAAASLVYERAIARHVGREVQLGA